MRLLVQLSRTESTSKISEFQSDSGRIREDIKLLSRSAGGCVKSSGSRLFARFLKEIGASSAAQLDR